MDITAEELERARLRHERRMADCYRILDVLGIDPPIPHEVDALCGILFRREQDGIDLRTTTETT